MSDIAECEFKTCCDNLPLRCYAIIPIRSKQLVDEDADSSLDKILAVRAPVEGRPGVPTRRAGARCHSIERLFVESGRRESVAEPEEKSASTLPASGLPPGRRPYPTLMDRLSATKLSKLERFSMPNKMLARLRRRKMFLLLGLGAGVAALGA